MLLFAPPLQRSSLVVLRGTLRAAAHASHLPTSGGAPDPARRHSDDSKDAGGCRVATSCSTLHTADAHGQQRRCVPWNLRMGRMCADETGTKDAKSSKDGGGSTDDGKGDSGGRYSVLVQYHAPCIMPWLWDEAAPSADPRMRPLHISLRAGSRGAILL